MNEKARELYELWDGALNNLWGELRNTLPEEEYAGLPEQQRRWIAHKEKAVENAGMEYQGGSIYQLIVNLEAAKITESRVYELYEILKQVRSTGSHLPSPAFRPGMACFMDISAECRCYSRNSGVHKW